MNLLDAIIRHFERERTISPRLWPDRRGEYWCQCPYHDDRHIGSFSFSERGFACFACDAKGSLRRLAQHLRLIDGYGRDLPKPKSPKPALSFRWQQDRSIPRCFQPIPPFAWDYLLDRGFVGDTIDRWRIGYGVLPASRCRLPRIILPVYENGRLVGLKGRAVLPQDTDAKWLQSAGSKPALFGAEMLTRGCSLIVTEAPFSAMLWMQRRPDIPAVASSQGASTWLPGWTERIAAVKPKQVLVVYDHDDAGLANGVKVTNDLLTAGLHVTLYRWPAGTPMKADLADAVTTKAKSA